MRGVAGFEFWGIDGCSEYLRLGVVLRWFRVWSCRGFRACEVWVCLVLAPGLGVWIDCWLGCL